MRPNRRFCAVPALLRSGRGVMLLSALVMAIIAATAGFTVWESRREAFNEHQRNMASLGVVLAEQTARYVQVIDLIMQEVAARAADTGVATPAEFQRRLGTPEVHALLADLLKNVPQADAVALVGADGLVLNWSRALPVTRLDVSGRDYFAYLRDHEDAGIFIGSPARSRVTGNWSLFFARRISGPDGRFLGLVLGIADAGYLTDFYRSLSLHRGETVTLLRRDGTLLIRNPDPVEITDARLPPGSPWHGRVAEGGGFYLGPGGSRGAPSLVTVAPLRDYPLVVQVALATAIILADWYREAAYLGGLALAGALFSSGLFWILGRQFGWQAEQNVRLEAAAQGLREGQQTLRAFAEMSADWFWEQDADFRFKVKTDVPSLMAYDDTGMTRWELAGAAMTEEQWTRHKADLAARIPFRNFRWERFGPDGARHVMITSGNPVFDRAGAFTGYHGTGREITAEVEAHTRLAKANADLELSHLRIEAVLHNITQGVCLFDGEQRVLMWNRRYAEIYDLLPEQIRLGSTLDDILKARAAAGSSPDMASSEYPAWRAQIDATNRPSNTITPMKNGRVIAIGLQPLSDGGWVATHEDVTERQHAVACIAFMAQHDALTRLPNRALFRERMQQAIAMAGRGSKFALLCLDLDKFKLVNDTLGHPVGDGLLQAVADRLTACVREGDTVSRLGGDEFAIIQLAIGQPDDADLLANRIIGAFRKPFLIDGRQITIGTSIGVTVAPGDGAEYEALLRNADIALYLAKTEGRGTVRFFEPEMDARIETRRVLELDLREAIARDEFELYYQPLVNLAAGKVTGFEALLRWHHPIRGLVSPLDFIPVAEETGMIVAIGEWVLRMACFEAQTWPADISVAVNLSSVQFKKSDLVATVLAALNASGLRADRLELEITESVLLQDTVGTLTALHQLRASGISIALDDFGTGYSSLSYLRSFPFDKLKIDQSFVRDLVKNRESMSIIRAITALGHSLSMKTTAEGVETEEQLERLRDEGCTEVQGYLFSRPRPAGELASLLRSVNAGAKILQ